MNITKLVLGACSTNVYIVSSNKKNAILIDLADNAILQGDKHHALTSLYFIKKGLESLIVGLGADND